MVNAVKWADPTSRATNIAGASLAAGGNLLSDAIANETNKDRYLALELLFSNSGTTSTGTFIETYLLYAQDGTNYEDGSAAVDPKKTFDNVFINAGTAAGSPQRQNIPDIPINPFNFKVLLKSEFTNAISGVTLSAHTYNEEIQ